jgi:hypothetical protein
MKSYRKIALNTGLSLVALLALSACGGGGGSTTTSSMPLQGVISGVATKGPINNGIVTAYGINAGQLGTPLATANTDSVGNFSMNIGSYTGPVMLQVSGGSYTDEATGVSMPLAAGDVMTAIMPTVAAGASSSGIQVTPVTAMAQAMAQHMAGGMTDANIAAANSAIGSNFSVSDILHVAPMNPLVSGSGTGASQDAQNYGMTLAAMSQYAQDRGMSSSSAIVTAMMNDASDGVLDGKAPDGKGGTASVYMGGMAGGVPLPASAGTSGMGAAMNAFMTSPQNQSGVSTATLMSKLTGTNAQIPVSPGNPVPMMNASVSGTAFDGTVSGGTVMAFAINNGAVGAQIASAAVDGQGNFTLPMGSYTGGVILQMGGASYVDPATKTSMTMPAGDVMTAVLPSVPAGANVAGVWVTPVTSMAQTRALAMSGGMTDANIAAANTAMGNFFSVGDILHTQPMNPALAGGAGATVDAQNYGMVLAAMSQSAKTLGMTTSSAFVSAMMKDAADGVIDGKMGASQIAMAKGGIMGAGMMAASAGTSGLATAMTDFMNSAANASGLTVSNMAAMMQKLNSSSGKI